MILDIGCGDSPQGDVNVDLFINPTAHRGMYASPLNTKTIPNLVKADAHHLPFKDGSFYKVYSSHTIEHVENPFQMLKEMVRVSKREIEVVCPFKYQKHHIAVHVNPMNKRWFMAAFEKLGIHAYKMIYTKYWSLFNSQIIALPFRIPLEIQVIARKVGLS